VSAARAHSGGFYLVERRKPWANPGREIRTTMYDQNGARIPSSRN